MTSRTPIRAAIIAAGLLAAIFPAAPLARAQTGLGTAQGGTAPVASDRQSSGKLIPLRVMLVISDAVRGYKVREGWVDLEFGARLAKKVEKNFRETFTSVQVVADAPGDVHPPVGIDLIVSVESPHGWGLDVNLTVVFVARRPNGEEIFRVQESASEEGNRARMQDRLGDAVSRMCIQDMLLNTSVRTVLSNASVAAAPAAPGSVESGAGPKSDAVAAASERGVSPVMGTAAGSPVSGGSYALIIGIDHYAKFPQLRTAVKDAEAVEAILREDYGFQTQLLLDGQADREHIMTLLSGYRRTLTADSNLLIYYAGHGIHDRESDKVYWLPVDAAPDNSANWLLTDDITSEIRAIPARHVLVVADSCYAGGMTRGAEALFTPEEHDRFLEKMAASDSRDLLSSGGDEPVADAGGAGDHSVFAAAMLKGLTDMQAGTFTGAELFANYIRVAVAGQSEQAPEYNFIRNSGHDGGDFVFVRRKP